MILSDHAIRKAIDEGDIVIEPFDPSQLGTNSYDVCLGKTLATYVDETLDAREHNKIAMFEIPGEGHNLWRGAEA